MALSFDSYQETELEDMLEQVFHNGFQQLIGMVLQQPCASAALAWIPDNVCHVSVDHDGSSMFTKADSGFFLRAIVCIEILTPYKACKFQREH